MKKKMPKHIGRGYDAKFDQSYLSPSKIWLNGVIPPTYGQDEKENWISALLRKHLDNVNPDSEISDNNLTIITFNYDTIIQNFFTESIRIIPKFKKITHQLIPKVLHVYGAFNELKDYPRSQDIFKHSENISYIHENNEQSTETVTDIKNEISQAECIFIVGFDAAKQNCDKINLANSPAYKFALNYDGNIGLNNRLEDVGVPSINIMTGSLPKACRESFFEQGDRLPKPAIYNLDNL